MRFLHVVLDLSSSVAQHDFRPSRLSLLSSALQEFIREFFNQNPLGQLAVTVTRNGVAENLTPLSSSPEAHVAKVKANLDSGGSASLQNALEVATESLKHVPPYGHREILVLFSSLTTCDPGDIHRTIEAVKLHRITCSVVGLGAELFLLRRLADRTAGSYRVATSEAHVLELLNAQATAPPTKEADATPASLVRMGFPQLAAAAGDSRSFAGAEGELAGAAYACPRCGSRSKELPCECHVCGLNLISAAHLARSYHHLFPPPTFVEVPAADNRVPACYGCGVGLPGAGGGGGEAEQSILLECPECTERFCFACDLFIHEELHTCPGCEAMAGRGGKGGGGVGEGEGGTVAVV